MFLKMSVQDWALPDGEGLVPEEPVLHLHEVHHGGVLVDQLRLVEVDDHIQYAVHGCEHVD